jgi:hypothetical protein
MLRLLVLLLILANGLYFAWSHGHLAFAGLQPAQVGEPQRLEQQIKPQAVSLIKPEDLRKLEAQVKKPVLECWQSHVLTDAQAKDAQTRLSKADSGWSADSWVLEKGSETALWMVYMGPFPNKDAIEKKRTELKRLNVGHDLASPKGLGEGLSLGTSHEKQAMDAKLATLSKQGVRTAKVVQIRAAATGQVLKFPALPEEQRSKLDALKAWLPATDDKPLNKCSG